jgi:hypothetical protein
MHFDANAHGAHGDHGHSSTNRGKSRSFRAAA